MIRRRHSLLAAGFAAALFPLAADAQHPGHGGSQADEMARARHMLTHHHGGMTTTYIEGERLEYRSHGGDPLFLWDVQGWWGGDINKLWIKSEGEYAFGGGGAFEEAEVQALWSRAIGGYFDVQAGVRHDFSPNPDRTYGVIGLEGLAPYLFEVDAAAFVSDQGDVTARVEVEYELMLSQRLILQPRTELNFAAQDIVEYGIGAGLSDIELGARLRYEFRRQFAPYVGVDWERAVGATADFAHLAGEEPGEVSFVAGVRTWF